MTWGEFRRWVREMEPLHAESLLDAAEAATVPQMTKEGAQEWYDRQLARVRSTMSASEMAPRREEVSWNGKVLSIFEFKQAVRRGFQAA